MAIAEMDDLEALFDQVAAESAVQREAAAAAPADGGGVAAPTDAVPADSVVAVAPSEPAPPAEVYNRLGCLTRSLHDALRELGYDKAVEDAVSSLPDARDRLTYIAELTGKSAERSLAAAEQGQQLQGTLEAQAQRLAEQWQRVFNAEMPLDEFKSTAVQTRAFLEEVPRQTAATSAQFTEIMMAQDFHDLTGQVIQRVVKVARDMEAQLLKLLIETTPPEKRSTANEEWLTGPVVNAAGRDDVVTDQKQVDDLLESLGF